MRYGSYNGIRAAGAVSLARVQHILWLHRSCPDLGRAMESPPTERATRGELFRDVPSAHGRVLIDGASGMSAREMRASHRWASAATHAAGAPGDEQVQESPPVPLSCGTAALRNTLLQHLMSSLRIHLR